MSLKKLQARIARTVIVLLCAGFIQTGLSAPMANAAAPIEPTISSITSGATSLTVNLVTTGIDASSWRWAITKRTGVSCANTYGDGAVQSTASLTSTISITGLTSGCTYSVKVAGYNGVIGDYNEMEKLVGAFTAGLNVYYKNETGFSAVSTHVPFTTGTCGTGTVTRIDWDYGGTGPSGCNTDGFTSYYIGYIKAPYTGSVTFRASTDDGFYLNIQGQNVIAYAAEGAATAYNATGSINMVANEVYRVEVWHHEYNGNSAAKLFWDWSGQTTTIVPDANYARDPSVFYGTCTLGMVDRCAAGSALEIKQATGTNMDGQYWIMVSGTPTLVYCIMNSAQGGGGWMLAMKGKSSSTAFTYNSSYWVNNSLTGTSSYPERYSSTDSRRNEDAKYAPYTSLKSNQIMALFPDYTNGGGAYSATNTSQTGINYGFSWSETFTTTGSVIAPWTAYNSTTGWGGTSWNQGLSGGPTEKPTDPAATASCIASANTLTNLFLNANRCAFRQVSDTWNAAETPYSAIGNGLFYSQNRIRFFGINYGASSSAATSQQYKARIGFGWNESVASGEDTSNDGEGGIGLYIPNNATQGAGTYYGCCQTQAGVGSNTHFAFEVYVRNTVKTEIYGNNLRVTYKRTNSLTAGNGFATSATNGSNTFRLNPMREGFSINSSTGQITVSEAIAIGDYSMNVTVTDTDGVTGVKAVTVQVISESLETDTALSFDGVSQYSATTGTYGLWGDQTYEMWVKPGSACTQSTTNSTPLSTVNFAIYCKSNYWYISFQDSSSNWSNSQTSQRVISGAWVHIAAVRSGSTVTAYINNSQVNFWNGSAWASSYTQSTIKNSYGSLYVGGTGTANQYFSGVIDEIKIWDSARTSAQVWSGANAFEDVSTPGLLGYWDFNEGSGFAITRSQRLDNNFSFTPNSASQWVSVVTTASDGPYTVVSIPRTVISRAGGWKVPASVTLATTIVVGGGGGAGKSDSNSSAPGGAGGGGGVTYSPTQTLQPGEYLPILVGVGGLGATTKANDASVRNGTSSYLGVGAGLTALGGGGGGSNGYPGAGGSTIATGGGGGGNPSATACAVLGSAGGVVDSGYNGGAGGWGWGGAGGSARGAAQNASSSLGCQGATGTGFIDSITSIEYGRSGSNFSYSTWSVLPNYSKANNGWGGSVSYGTGAYTSGEGTSGSNGLVLIRFITALKPTFTSPKNAYLNVGMTETFTTTVSQDSATAGLTRTFRWESTTAGAGGTYSLIKQGTGAANAAFSWTPTDTSTSGSQYLFRVIVTDSDTAGLFIQETSTPVFAVINRALVLSSKSTLTKTVNISKTETFTVTFGTPAYSYSLTPTSANFWLDTSTVGSPRIKFADTVTVGTYYETFTVTDSVSASIVLPLTIVVSPPPSFSANVEQVDRGTVLYLDPGNTSSYSGSGTSWTDISGANLSTAFAPNMSGKLASSTYPSCSSPTYSTSNLGILNFSSTSSNLQCAYTSNIGLLASYTLDIWIKRNGSQTPWTGIISNPYSGSGKQINMALFWNTATTLMAGRYDGANWAFTGNSVGVTVPDNTWTHVIVLLNNSTLRMIVNGDTSTYDLVSATVTWDLAKLDTGLVIGRKWDGDLGFNGSIGSLRIYNRTLTMDEVSQNYNATKGRFLQSQNKQVQVGKYGVRYTDTFTVTAGSETITSAWSNSSLTKITWETSTAKTLVLTAQESLTPGMYYDTITVTDSYGSFTRLPLTYTIAKADTITVSMDTATVAVYNTLPLAKYPKPVIKGLVNSDTFTVTTKFSSTLYALSSTVPANADTYTVIAADPVFSVGNSNYYLNIVYETSTAIINRARQTPLNVSMYGAIIGNPFTITLLGGSGDGVVTESLTGMSTAPNCAISSHVLTSSATQISYCQLLVTKAGTQNYFSESSTAQIYFMSFVSNQPTNQVGSGSSIALNGETAITRDASVAPTITSLGSLSGSVGGTVTINGAGFYFADSTRFTVKFWRNVFAMTNTYTSYSDSSVTVVIPAGATTGRIIVTTPNGSFASEVFTVNP